MENHPLMYGVWIPGEGWLKCKDDPFADYDKGKARQVARMVGMGARVMFIDKGIVALEKLYLEREGRLLCQRLRNFFKRNNSK